MFTCCSAACIAKKRDPYDLSNMRNPSHAALTFPEPPTKVSASNEIECAESPLRKLEFVAFLADFTILSRKSSSWSVVVVNVLKVSRVD